MFNSKSLFGSVLVVSLLVGTAGVASAAVNASASGFIGAAPVDVTFIDHPFGRWVTNNDPNSSRNTIVNLGTVSSGTVTFNVRGSHESADTGPMKCLFIFDQITTGAELPLGVMEWDASDSSVKTLSFTIPGVQTAYFATLFCTIPPMAVDGSRIFGVWAS